MDYSEFTPTIQWIGITEVMKLFGFEPILTKLEYFDHELVKWVGFTPTMK